MYHSFTLRRNYPDKIEADLIGQARKYSADVLNSSWTDRRETLEFEIYLWVFAGIFNQAFKAHGFSNQIFSERWGKLSAQVRINTFWLEISLSFRSMLGMDDVSY